MKQRLKKTELEDLKKVMRLWDRVQLEKIKLLYWHIEALEEENKKYKVELDKFRQESLIETFDDKKKNFESRQPWPTPSCSHKIDEDLPLDKRGTKQARIINLFKSGKMNTTDWELNLKYSKLTQDEAVKILREAGINI